MFWLLAQSTVQNAKPATFSLGFGSLVKAGGVVVIILIVLSVLALAIFMERLIFYRKSRVNTREFLKQIRVVVSAGRVDEAIKLCEETPGPIPRVVKAALEKAGSSEAEIRQAVEDATVYEVPLLEKNLGYLATIASISTLLGLFGTVTGMIKSFFVIAEAGTGNPALLAKGIAEALVTTAAGLLVAIPVLIAYNYLVAKVDSIVWDMEKAAVEIVGMLKR